MNLSNIELISFTNLSDDEKEMILEWRNNDSVRKWMYSPALITKKTHFDFIKNLETDKNNKYFLVRRGTVDTGVIYFNKIDLLNKTSYFGLYANPTLKIAGIGRTLEKACIKYAFDELNVRTLKLEVFSENNKAINLYKKFNFKQTDEKMVNGKKVICMELENEN